MSSMSDLHIDICEEIEKVMCEELSMEKCQRTYEIASLIFDAVNKKLTSLNLNPDVVHIGHADANQLNIFRRNLL